MGEHFGYLFTALWTIMVAALMWSQARYVAMAGLVIAAGVLFGMLEPFGVGAAATVVALSFSAWALWTLIVGVLVLRGRQAEIAAMPVAA